MVSKNFVKQDLPTTSGTLYTVPGNKTVVIRNITGINRDNYAASTWFVYLVDSGDTAGIENVLINGESLDASERDDISTWKVLEGNGTIEGYSPEGDVTVHIDGILVDR